MFVIGPDKKIKLILVYPMTTGRNFDEVLRVIDSLQLTASNKVATPVNWKPGEDVIIAGSVSDDEAKETYPDGWESPQPYIRLVPDPGGKRLGARLEDGAVVELADGDGAVRRRLEAEAAEHALVDVLLDDLDAAVAGGEDVDRADLLELLRQLGIAGG